MYFYQIKKVGLVSLNDAQHGLLFLFIPRPLKISRVGFSNLSILRILEKYYFSILTILLSSVPPYIDKDFTTLIISMIWIG